MFFIKPLGTGQTQVKTRFPCRVVISHGVQVHTGTVVEIRNRWFAIVHFGVGVKSIEALLDILGIVGKLRGEVVVEIIVAIEIQGIGFVPNVSTNRKSFIGFKYRIAIDLSTPKTLVFEVFTVVGRIVVKIHPDV